MTDRDRRSPQPPRLARLIIKLVGSAADRDAMAGDLDEEYRRYVRPSRSRLQANAWYWSQVIRSLLPLLWRRWYLDRRVGPAESDAGRQRFQLVCETLRDARVASRVLAKNPSFSLVALATIALAVATTTTVFSVVHGVLLRPLPYSEPDRIVRFHPDQLFISNGMAVYLAERAKSFEQTALWGRRLFLFSEGDRPEEYRGAMVSTNHFDMLGVRPVLGRAFLPGENTAGADRVMIISHQLWRSRFGSDPAIVGRSVLLAGTPYTVVGVLGPGHQPLESDWQVWVPMNMDDGHPHRHSGTALNGRLRDGVVLEAAAEELRRLTADFAELRGWDMAGSEIAAMRLVGIRQWMLGDTGPTGTLMLGAVALVLLMACANVANLLLARANGRRRELAVRIALGAKRGRVARQLITENMLLGLAGGALGTALAAGAFGWSVSLLPPGVPRAESLVLDTSVLLSGFMVSLVATILFGLVPAVQVRSVAPAGSLAEGGAASGRSRGTYRLDRTLVAVEMAISVILLTGAGLLVRTMVELQRSNPGFDGARVVTVRPRLFGERYRDEQALLDYHRRVHQTLTASPAVMAAGGISILPMTSGGHWGSYTLPESSDTAGIGVSMRIISPGYLAAMGIPLLAGRDFQDGDVAGSPAVVLVNSALARRAWPEDNGVGRVLLLGSGRQPHVVVGVIGDVRQSDMRTEVNPEVYLPLAQAPTARFSYAVKLAGSAGSGITLVRELFRSVDPSLQLVGLQTVNEVVGRTIATERFLTALLGTFAAVALLLGAVGVYGVMAFIVGQRTRQIGIRIALGARPAVVLRRTMAHALTPVLIGMALGLAAAAAATDLIASFLYGATARDPAMMLVAVAVLFSVALGGCYLPARRASRIDPAMVLRES